MYVCTFVDSTVLDSQLFVPGYSIFRKDKACPRGELLIYIKHDLCCCCRTDLESENSESLSQSGMVEGMIRQAQVWFKNIYTLLYKIIYTTT